MGAHPQIGQTDEKFCGSHKLFRSDGTRLPHPETPMGRVRTGQLARDEEVIIERPDGSRVTVLVNIAPLFDESDKQIGAVNCFQDLSAQKQTEKEREQLREELHQAQKMEAVGQLTGGLSHDFNNLLAGISGSLELMQRLIEQGRINDLNRYITAALGASTRAAALTHRLLAFSRRQPLNAEPTDIGRLVVGMEELVCRTVGPEIAVEVVTADGLWNAFVDPNQLENALLNLCINAHDAMADGGKLLVETANISFDERTARERDMPPGQYVSLCVSDNGTGMPHAFDPFYTTKPIGMGTGLGLSMIYNFARQSGGLVRIYSEPSRGTTVCLYLPRSLGEADLAEAPAELVETPRAEQGERVLVVDDDPTVLMSVTELLGDLGYVAVEAMDGPDGLRVLQSDARIDLLITDIGLSGGMNGRQFVDAARKCRRDLKVLFITGYAEHAVLSHGHSDTGMNVVTKPFAIEVLANRIRDLIKAP
jgi:signal transduction histidine kinase